MVYICKPSKIQIYINSYPYKTIDQIKSETNCDAIVNGGLYNMKTYEPACHLKVDGKLLGADKYTYFGYGWDTNGFPVLVSDYSEFDNYICCVCLVRNSKPEILYYDSSVGGSRPRTAIGTFPDGRIWLYADSSNKTPEQLRNIALEAGVKDAIMLDGGGSTQCIFPTGNVNSARKVQNYICIWEEKENTSVTKPIIFRVQVGAFKNKIYAENMLEKLKADGFPNSYVVQTNDIYRVQVGAFKDRKYAEVLKNNLTSIGYKAIVT